MDGKIEFGCDYLYMMRIFQLRDGKDGRKDVSDAAARLFLLQWDFSVEEIDRANELFWDRLKSKTLEPDMDVVVGRLVKYIKGDKAAQERLIIELAAIGVLDGHVTEDEAQFVFWFRDALDMRPSEYKALTDKGSDWAIALNFFGEQYIEEKKKGN